MSDSVNVKVLNDFDRELVKVVAAVLVDPTTGQPYKVTGGGGSSGGDVDLSKITALIGTLSASPDAQTQLGRLKTIADLLVAAATTSATQHSENQTDLNALVTALGTLNTTEANAATILAAIRDSVKVPQWSSVSIRSVATSASAGATPTVFSSFACTALDIVNDTGTDIEYLRSGDTGIYMPILAGTSRLITGITNANLIGVRRVDQLTTAVTVKGEAFVL